MKKIFKIGVIMAIVAVVLTACSITSSQKPSDVTTSLTKKPLSEISTDVSGKASDKESKNLTAPIERNNSTKNSEIDQFVLLRIKFQQLCLGMHVNRGYLINSAGNIKSYEQIKNSPLQEESSDKMKLTKEAVENYCANASNIVKKIDKEELMQYYPLIKKLSHNKYSPSVNKMAYYGALRIWAYQFDSNTKT